MPEDNRYDAVVSYDAMRFREGARDHLVVVGRGAVIVRGGPASFDDCLLVLLLDAIRLGREGEPWRRRDQRALEPYEEQI